MCPYDPPSKTPKTTPTSGKATAKGAASLKPAATSKLKGATGYAEGQAKLSAKGVAGAGGEAGKKAAEKKTDFGPFDPKGQLSTVHPDLQAKAKALADNAHAAGLDIKINEGYRSHEAQDKLYAQGRTEPGKIVTKAKGGQSWHNYGIAIDVIFHGKNPYGEEHDWDALGKAGEDAGLEWGGRWTKMVDRPHFQLPGLDLESLQA